MRRSVLIVAVLCVAAIVAWLAFLRPDDRSAEIPTAATEAVPSAGVRSSDAEANAQSVEAHHSTEAEAQETTRSTAAVAGNPARLAVQVVSQETRQAMPGWRVFVLPVEPPIEGWMLADVDRERAQQREAPVTNAEGRAWIECPPGHSLEVRALDEQVRGSGLQPTAKIQALLPGAERVVVLEVQREPNLTLYVSALDAERRTPVPGVRVRALRAHLPGRSGAGAVLSRPDEVLLESQTGSDGLCRLVFASRDRPYLQLEGAGYGRALAHVDDGHSTPATALEVQLTRAAELRGVVSGAVNCMVQVRASSEWLLPTDLRSMLSDLAAEDPLWTAMIQPDGSFAFDALPSSCGLHAAILRPGSEMIPMDHNLRLAPGEVRVVAWNLVGVCTVRGQVRDRDQSPVGGVEIWLIPGTSPHPHVFDRRYEESQVASRARADASGAFEITGIRTGTWQIGLAARESLGSTSEGCIGLSQAFTIAHAEVLREIVLTVDCDLFIEGRVVSPDGRVPEFAFVQALASESPGSYSTQTVNGQFKIGPLIRGRYKVTASGNGHASTGWREVEAGAKDVVMHLQAGATIEGRVLDDVGTPGPFEIQLSSAEGSLVTFVLLGTTTAVDGAFSFSGLEPGNYALIASSSGGRYGVRRGVQAVSGAVVRNADVRLEAGARLRVKSTFEEGSILVRSDDTLIHVLQPNQTGTVECALPPGRIRVQLARYRQVEGKWTPEIFAEGVSDLLPGEVKELEIEPP